MRTKEEIEKKILDSVQELGKLEPTAENVSAHKRIRTEIRALNWVLGTDDNAAK